MIARLPPDEKERLDALRHYEILDTGPEQSFDDITLLASHSLAHIRAGRRVRESGRNAHNRRYLKRQAAQISSRRAGQIMDLSDFFLLGNHDFYQGSFAEVDALIIAVRTLHPNLIELGHGEIIKLGSKSVLIGHRGWADGRAGTGSQSAVRLNDHQYIADLRELNAPALFAELNRLGDESADYISRIAPTALGEADRLILATHVPPFQETALFQNKPSDPDFAPHFTNIAMGRAISAVAQEFPDKSLAVLCGHTHHKATYSPAPNLTIEVAAAMYHHPQIAAKPRL